MNEADFVTGSHAFFDGMDGFHPHDTDVVVFRERQTPFIVQCRRGDTTVYFFGSDKAEDIIGHFEQHPQPAMQVAMLLAPEIAERVGMTTDYLPRLQFLIDALDERHAYLSVIYGSYVKNKALTLLEHQREEAFNLYKKFRLDG